MDNREFIDIEMRDTDDNVNSITIGEDGFVVDEAGEESAAKAAEFSLIPIFCGIMIGGLMGLALFGSFAIGGGFGVSLGLLGSVIGMEIRKK